MAFFNSTNDSYQPKRIINKRKSYGNIHQIDSEQESPDEIPNQKARNTQQIKKEKSVNSKQNEIENQQPFEDSIQENPVSEKVDYNYDNHSTISKASAKSGTKYGLDRDMKGWRYRVETNNYDIDSSDDTDSFDLSFRSKKAKSKRKKS